MLRPTRRQVLVAHGVYYVATGLAPFVSRSLFERVTGPKREWWLVQTTGVLVTAVGGGVLHAVRRGRETPEIVGTAAGCAAGLAAIDLVQVVRGRISPVYLVDAVIEAGLLAGRVGEEFAGVITSVREDDPRRGVVVLSEIGVEAAVTGAADLPVGTDVRVRLETADLAARKVAFRLG